MSVRGTNELVGQYLSDERAGADSYAWGVQLHVLIPIPTQDLCERVVMRF